MSSMRCANMDSRRNPDAPRWFTDGGDKARSDQLANLVSAWMVLPWGNNLGVRTSPHR
jgi:hypothetical protein